MKYISPFIVRQVFVMLLIVLMGGLIFKEMLPYLGGVLGAITIYVLLRKPMLMLVKKGWHPNLAAWTLIITSFTSILLPLVAFGFMIGNRIEYAVTNSEQVVQASKTQLQKLEEYLNYDVTSQIDPSAISSWLSKSLQSIAGNTFTIFISITVMYFLLYFMLISEKKIKDSLFTYIPINSDNLETIGNETFDKVRSNALGIPLVAIAQGVVALIGFFIFSIPNPFFWATVVTIGSMVPFVGSAIGTLPVFILALANGNSFQAWGILLYGTLVIGATDNLFRLYILKKLDDVHPIITLIGVLVGVPLFGFIGLIFGPILVSLFLIILRIYKNEYGQNSSA
ncbi:hypothetical protein KCTC52924_01859 [Arenibacter antarcticus]|uniref:AI-2E family transporter n=1 Tax=Arenibacter antarcticus TaxID=2040469 RepID=A0ABW5VLU1_9FLAO|nr:AI-2E family transporter [Arenibacter sp. H213]MCM4167003.1 AI-2E family transporter [Arenibacter sp. H213]